MSEEGGDGKEDQTDRERSRERERERTRQRRDKGRDESAQSHGVDGDGCEPLIQQGAEVLHAAIAACNVHRGRAVLGRCERETERERERERECVCVCVRDRERERDEQKSEREREREKRKQNRRGSEEKAHKSERETKIE